MRQAKDSQRGRQAHRHRWGPGVAGAAALAAALALAGGAALAVPSVTGATAPPTVLQVVHNATWGQILALADGRTVYRLVPPHGRRADCTGTCATVWPPVLLAAGQRHPEGRGIAGLGSVARPDGARQVTVDGEALYLYRGDRRAGSVDGDLADRWGRWWVVDAAHPRQAPVPVTGDMGTGMSGTVPAVSSGGTGGGSGSAPAATSTGSAPAATPGSAPASGGGPGTGSGTTSPAAGGAAPPPGSAGTTSGAGSAGAPSSGATGTGAGSAGGASSGGATGGAGTTGGSSPGGGTTSGGSPTHAGGSTPGSGAGTSSGSPPTSTPGGTGVAY